MTTQGSRRAARPAAIRRFALPIVACGAAWCMSVASGAPQCVPEWAALASGTNGRVRAMAVFDDGLGTGPSLYAGGVFDTAGDVLVNNIARWDGTTWHPIGTGIEDYGVTVMCMAAAETPAGPMLFIGGWFGTADGMPVDYVTAWNGAECCALASGMNNGVLSLATFDDGLGGGEALYAGGLFTVAGGVAANSIAKWDGQTWSPLGLGMNGGVYALATFDDGSGEALYAGGDFTTAGLVNAKHIAKWNGESWTPVGTGTNDTVHTLAVYDDGNGPALYAGGMFTKAGGATAEYIAKWDGATWSELGYGGMNNSVHALKTFDDGFGEALYVGGKFTDAYESHVNYITGWNGSIWLELGSGMNGRVQSLAVFDDGSGFGPALYAGGLFTTAGGIPANHIARWGCQTVCGADLNGDWNVDAMDLALLLGDWDQTTSPADIDHDGTVGAADLAILLGAWGSCPGGVE